MTSSMFTRLKRCWPLLAFSLLLSSYNSVPAHSSTQKTEYAVSRAGDVNGDGFSDVLVTVYITEYGVGKGGNAFLYYGGRSGISPNPVWTGSINQQESNYGASVAWAGDVNGDGFADIIVGASHYSNGESNEGAAFVYYGSPTGLDASPSWSAEGDQANAFFGASVAGAGDVNKDGYSDVIIGAPLYDHGETNEGMAFIYYGSPNGLHKEPAWTAEGDQVSANFGKSVAGAGDVNFDGYADVLVGAPNYDNGQNNEGRAFLFSGTNMGVTKSPTWTGESNQAEANYGDALASAGDVNNDGFSDIVIGANRYDEGQSNVGKIYVYYGSANGISMYPDWTFTGNLLDGNLGISVSGGGDVNGDGFHDIVVGSFTETADSQTGNVYVFYGSRHGMTNDVSLVSNGSFPQATIGLSVSAAGDINGDGYADLIAGIIIDKQSTTTLAGKAMMVQGSAKGIVTGNSSASVPN